MNKKRFIIYLTVKVITYAIISTIALSLLNSPVITNEIALTQMENSNELYMLMETYNKSRPFISIIYGCITTWFVGTTVYGIYKFIKKETKEKN